MNRKIVSFVLLTILCTSMLCLASSKLSEVKLGSNVAASTSSCNAYGASGMGLSLSDSASWRMFRNDLNHSGYSTSKAPSTNQTIWSFATGGFVDSSPAVFEGKVFFGSRDSKVYALNATTGTKIWSYAVGGEVFCSPAFAYGKVYVGSYDGYLYALNASDGILMWRNMTGNAIASSPAVDDAGRVFVGSGNSVFAFDAFTGSQIWSYTTGGEVDSAPAIWNGTVYIGSGDYKIYALNASTGTKIWSFATGGTVLSSPAVADGKVYVGSYDYTVYCLSAFDGSSVWNYTTNAAVRSSPAVAGGKIYVGSGDYALYVLDASTGSQYWNYTTGGFVYSCPAVADGKVFVGSYDDKMYAFDASGGFLVWSYATGGHVISSPAVADGRVFVGSEDGKVYAFGWITVPDNYPTIQQAINAANAGATVFVRNGSYSEDVVVNKTGLHLLGECNVATMISATDLPLDSAAVNVLSSSVEVSGFTLSRSGQTGIDLVNSSCAHCSISNNIVGWDTNRGIVSSGNYTSITDNEVGCYDTGIILNGSSFNTVDGNTVSGSTVGIALFTAGNSVVSDNRISSNANGMTLVASHDTRVFHNSFIGNTHQVVVDTASQSNTWDDGYPSGGNYWSDYSGSDAMQGQYQNFLGSDGLGDTPYTMDSKDIDHYPLVAAPYPDVRVVSVTPLRSFGYSILPISVQVENTGSQTRSLNVTVYANKAVVGQAAITVPPLTNNTCIVYWHTTVGNVLPLSHKNDLIAVTNPAISAMRAQAQELHRPPLSPTCDLRVFASYQGRYVVAPVTVTGPKNFNGGKELHSITTADPNNPLWFGNIPPGNYHIEATYDPDPAKDCDGSFAYEQTGSATVYSDVYSITDANVNLDQQTVTHVGMGYFIIVQGYGGTILSSFGSFFGCVHVYRTLLDVGIKKDHIYFLCQPFFFPADVDEDGQNDAWIASSDLLHSLCGSALENGEVNLTEPLFLYLCQIGAQESKFQIRADESIMSWTLNSWLDDLESATGCHAHVIIDADHSGSFIPPLSKAGRIIITSCQPGELVWWAANFQGGAFSQAFCNDIRSGLSLEKAFWSGGAVLSNLNPRQNPLLDDNGDRMGWFYNTQLGIYPGCDGYLAKNTYIGMCEWPTPWMSQVMPGPCFSWPPSNVTLWAKVENKTSLANVTAWMLPSDLVPPNSTSLEGFEMTDLDHDGNWTVVIPAINFTNHASGPSSFTFFITAEEADGFGATPSIVNVQFTASGEPLPDTVSPFVFEERPLENRVVCGTIKVNGTVSDNICIDRVELYANGTLQGTTLLPPLSTSYFELSLDTTVFANGNNTILLKAYDKAGNSNNETITFFVQNFVHNIALTDLAISKTVVCQGYTLNLTVTSANVGSYSENFNLSLYANATQAKTQALALSSQNSATTTFVWNSSGFARGNYTMIAYASQISNETNTADNMLAGNQIIVTIVGDVNGDGKVNLIDVFSVALAYGSYPGHPTWNPNYDINNDNKINLIDYFVTALNYGKTDL